MALAEEASPPKVRYETQIQSILDARCKRCHGGEKRSAELSLASSRELLKGSESGPVIVAGKPDESLLVEMVKAGEMPPKDNPALTPAEFELIRRWIAEGASFSESAPVEVTQHQIVPLMLLRCAACHGGRRREADLDLRTKAGILKGGKSGPAAVPGKPEESLLIRRIHAEEMPPRRLLVSVSVKPMESNELKMLEAWIAAGMPESPVGPDVATAEPDVLVTDADRHFWSFQPVQPVALPSIRNPQSTIRNGIDAFILARLSEKGLSLSPEADRSTLIRRLSFDLVGLPPTPEEVARFVADPSPLAYEALVDRLLASPHYGERWGRHWLDVAGYADSEGAQNEDRVRPSMWRYRDYVVRAFNADKPYDRFLHEQIAGDELADYEHAPVITDEIYDNLVATGFLRTAPDRTFANITNFVPDRLEVIADEVQILSSSVLGLTMHCCRCHSHKFDPLPQRDYYRLTAALKDALDEHDWLGPEPRQLNFVTAVERQAWEADCRQIDNRLAPLKEQLAAASDEAAKKKLQDEIAAIEKDRQPEPKIRALWSRGDPSPTYVLKRGNYLTPGNEVGPGVPSVLTDGHTPFDVQPPWPGAKTTGRRLALARWLTQPDHPLTARVIVNRVWKHHFGVGIVATPGNFGKTGAPPTHPELLDWLAGEFVRGGWSIKSLHRLMVTSATYQQSSQVTPELAAVDPENKLLSRMPLRRVEAEILRDSLLFVAGQLDESQFGPPVDVDVQGDGLVTAKSTSRGGRRSVYVLHRRTKLPTILETFDSPQMGPNCLERGESIVAPQALHLLNNQTVHELAGHFADRILAEAGADSNQQIVRAHQLAFGPAPADDELQIARETLSQLTQEWRSALGQQPDAEAQAARCALQNYCHAILNSAAFVYVD
jgi:mono/diheme cytochrome c family protein